MGDTKASTTQPPSDEPQGEIPATPRPSTRADSVALPVAESMRSAPTTSTAPPTDDIDSEWPDDEPLRGVFAAEAEPARPATLASALSSPKNEEDRGWISEAEGTHADSPLVSPSFPADPGLPRDLRSDAAVPSSRRGSIPEVPPSKRDMDTVPAAPQASRPPSSVNANSSARLRAAAEGAVAEAAAASARTPIVSRSEPPLSSMPAPEAHISSEPAREVRHTDDPHVHSQAHPDTRPSSRAPLVAALLVAAGVALWLLRPATPQAPPAEPVVAAAPPPVAAPVAPPAVAAPENEATKAAPEAAPKAEPTPEAVPAASEAAVAAAPAPSSSGTLNVVISVRPPQARVFYRGKEVGHPPVTVEIEAGKRRSYEVALPGFMTRKVVIDGSKPEVFVGLRPDPALPAAAPAR